MNCENCTHWQQDERKTQEKTVHVGKCNKIPMFWDATDWDRDSGKLIFTSDSLAFAQDGSDYSAYLLTKPNFYCNMWEANK